MVLWRMNDESSCYKMMFTMGVLDMLCLPICGIATGIMGIFGTAYCSWPKLIYVIGAFAMGK
jgi:hypothetical protein